MTNEQLAAYLEQLTMNLGRLLSDAQNQLNADGIEHEIQRKYETPDLHDLGMFRIGQPISFKDVETENIIALQPVFWFVHNLQENILTLDPKRTITNDI